MNDSHEASKLVNLNGISVSVLHYGRLDSLVFDNFLILMRRVVVWLSVRNLKVNFWEVVVTCLKLLQ